MKWNKISPENTEFVILCFEGPDRYSIAGGLGVRINNLSSTLAGTGFHTHLFFIGDPDGNGQETLYKNNLVLHRWCQWISKHYPNGVYDGENDKVYDFNESIPSFVTDRVIRPAVEQGKMVVILGEEWQTAETMCRLNDALHNIKLRDKVVMFWNANHTFGFDRIDWERLDSCTTITTVSRYMRHIIWQMSLNSLVIPNGIPKDLPGSVDNRSAEKVRQTLDADVVLCKVARWDPNKCWDMAIEAVAQLKQQGLKTILVARGGPATERHGREVLQTARSLGLNVKEARDNQDSFNGYLSALRDSMPTDVINVGYPLPLSFLGPLYSASDGVLANSEFEPFGIVGLETMAAGGVAYTGCTGEDYAIPFVNSFVLETSDPMEIVSYANYLRDFPGEDIRIRKAAKHTARQFTWEAAVRNLISKLENQAKIQEILKGKANPTPLPLLIDEDQG